MITRTFNLPLKGLKYSSRCFSTAAATTNKVKNLRDRTGAPMMDCKKALESENGDIEKAIDWLRAKGISKASNQASSGRKSTEGLIALKRVNNDAIWLAEVNSETDFVARNQQFQEFVSLVTNVASSVPTKNQDIAPETLFPLRISSSSLTIQDTLGDVISKIRENIVLRRVSNISTSEIGNATVIFGSYVHGKVETPFTTDVQMGRVAGVVELQVTPAIQSPDDQAKLVEAARKLAMHVVAARPSFRVFDEIPADLIAKETAIFREQSEESSGTGKPKSAEIMEKIIRGKVNKRLGEITLFEQNHVAETDTPVISKYLAALGKSLGASHSVTIPRFYLWTLGQTHTQ